MTPSSEQGWSIENKETVHEVMTRFLSLQQHPDLTSPTSCCVFTVGVETQLGFPRNTLKTNVQSDVKVFTACSQGLPSLIYIPLPGGLGRAGAIHISRIGINDLSFHDGVKTITKMDISQSHIHVHY